MHWTLEMLAGSKLDSVYFTTYCKSWTGAVLPFEPYPPTSTYNVEFLTQQYCEPSRVGSVYCCFASGLASALSIVALALLVEQLAGLGNIVVNSHLSPGPFSNWVLLPGTIVLSSYLPHWSCQGCLANCDGMLASYTRQSSYPCRHPTYWALSQWSYSVFSTPCYGH